MISTYDPKERRAFWNRKILAWENARYDVRFPITKSICYRLEIASHILQRTAKGNSILDLGCGSGRLFQKLQHHSFAKLIGVDVAEDAIRQARARAWKGEVSFLCGDVTRGDIAAVDCIVGLGLLDWLSETECNDLFIKIQGRRFLFSFSERRAWHLRILHRTYLNLVGPASVNTLRPSYLRADQVKAFAANSRFEKVYFYRDPRLTFGTFATNLPIAALNLPGRVEAWTHA